MANYTFNIAKGRPAALHDAVNDNAPANSAIVLIPLSAQGSEAEAQDYDTVSAVLGGTSDERTSGNWSRKILTDSDIVASVLNDTSNRRDLALPQVQWTGPAPTTGNDTVGLLIAYDPDTTGGTDADLIPISSHTFTVTANGNTVTLNAGNYMQSS
jgi:hypothetical protein